MKVDEVDEQLLTQLAYNARGDLCPMQGVIGGITAQEVMKVNVSLVYLSHPWVEYTLFAQFRNLCLPFYSRLFQYI